MHEPRETGRPPSAPSTPKIVTRPSPLQTPDLITSSPPHHPQTRLPCRTAVSWHGRWGGGLGGLLTWGGSPSHGSPRQVGRFGITSSYLRPRPTSSAPPRSGPTTAVLRSTSPPWFPRHRGKSPNRSSRHVRSGPSGQSDPMNLRDAPRPPTKAAGSPGRSRGPWQGGPRVERGPTGHRCQDGGWKGWSLDFWNTLDIFVWSVVFSQSPQKQIIPYTYVHK